MKKTSTIMVILLAGAVFAPGQAQAQGGPPAAVADRIPAEAAVGQERGQQARDRDEQARQRGPRGGAGQSAGRCQSGIDVALGTPAGAVLEGIFGRGGPAEHVAVCGDGVGQTRGGILDRLPAGGGDAGAARGGPPGERGNRGGARN